MVSDGTTLFWTMANRSNATMGEVRSCAVGGCNNMPKTLAMMQNAPSGIADDNMWLYWLNSDEHAIYKQIK
jgi:hypothetical protein